jgi:hypothetical protein
MKQTLQSERNEQLSKAINLEKLDFMLERLNSCLTKSINIHSKVKIWGNFIKFRDGYQCLKCFSKDRLEAHHIFRRCFQPQAELYAGNGITLCKTCHKQIHAKFNRRPRTDSIMNDQGGDDPDYITENFFYLIREAKKKNIFLNRYYFIGDDLMKRSQYFQGINIDSESKEPLIAQAFWLWRQCPPKMYKAVMAANGCSLEPPFDEGLTITLKDDGIYLTIVDIGENFEIENRGSATMFFGNERRLEDILETVKIIHPGTIPTIKDLRS